MSGSRESAWRARLDLFLVAVACFAVLFAFRSFGGQLDRLSPSGRVFALLVVQFAAAGAVPAALAIFRREPLERFRLTRVHVAASLWVGVALAAIYLIALSLATGAFAFIPFGRHGVLRLALELPGIEGALAPALVIAVWGVAEGLFGVYFAAKAAEIAAARGLHGAPTVGAIAFGAFNGIVHVAVGQGLSGFWTSGLSGTFVGLVPALTGNAWGGVLVQVLTNAAGPLGRS